MEQHRTRSPQPAPRRDKPPRPPVPPQAGRAAAGGVVRSARPERVPQRRNGPQARPHPPGRSGPQGRSRPVPERRPGPGQSAAQAVRRMPNPRLTGLGGGLFCALVMLTLGLLDAASFASQTAYGVLFLPVAALTAVWVRRVDLLTAPVVVPIAFAVGLVPLVDGDGTGGQIMGMVTGLATQAGWLYGGTLIAGVIVLVRRVRMIRRRNARNRPQG
ncbi:DUF6542 domain-containing protein [Streptomyces sp. NPDC012461]|uniref:DUF6542 domain-containing protein n=2 Tax=Streptomyces TaxID=1883 RepID=UPI0033EB8D36